MPKIADKLTQVRFHIQEVAKNYKRNPNEITLLAVSKKQSLIKIQQAYDLGQRDFGENYLQESLEKIALLKALAITWHFIGPVQSNKTRDIAENFSWVHSIDRLKIAERLSQQRPKNQPPLNICIQVNIDEEENKSGIVPGELLSFAQKINALEGIRLRGLMAIPQKVADPNKSSPFLRMHTLFNTLKNFPEFTGLDTLSMGMSADMEDAIANGATIVRIGTNIFGRRSEDRRRKTKDGEQRA